MKHPLYRILLPLLFGVLVVELWIFLHFALNPDRRLFFPRPDEILDAFNQYRPQILHAAYNTTKGTLIGFALAIVISSTLAIVLSASALVRATLYPYLMALQMTPLPILAPICVIWVDPGIKSVAVLTFVMAFFPLVVNTTQGLLSTDRNLVELFRLYRASWTQQLLRLRVPSALPYFFAGLRIAATIAPIGAVVADMNAGSSAGDGGGLGFQALIYSSQARYPGLYATAATTCLLGFVLNAIVLTLAWAALHRWHDSYEQTDR